MVSNHAAWFRSAVFAFFAVASMLLASALPDAVHAGGGSTTPEIEAQMSLQ